jgi:hypothetical protein
MGKDKQRMQAMTNYEKRQRNAEAAAVLRFLRMPKVKPAKKMVVKTAKIGRSPNAVVAAATVVQSMWRRALAKRAVAALKQAMASSQKAAADLAGYQRVQTQLQGSLDMLRRGHKLSAAAMLRGDMKKLHVLYGSRVAAIAHAMHALVRKRVALKAVAARRAEVEAQAAAAQLAAHMNTVELAAQRAAAGAALKAAAHKERAAALEMLCVHAMGGTHRTDCEEVVSLTCVRRLSHRTGPRVRW